jgi:dTDP-L-rhamnose 4-epimerase
MFSTLEQARLAQLNKRNCGDVDKSTTGFVTPDITNRYRQGDIRHCVADVTKLHRQFSPSDARSFETRVQELIEWSHQEKARDFSDKAQLELSQRGLV